MTICYFGMYASNYARNRTLIKGFRLNGVRVIECNDRSHLIWGVRYWKLLLKFIAIKGWTCDFIFVGFPGQTDVPLAWILGKIFHKRIFFDAFFSIYNSLVFDRKNFGRDSLRAKIWWLIDWLSCVLADKVILDTATHIKYFVKTFGIKKTKFTRVLVGTDTGIFSPKKLPNHKNFLVGFHGSYLPLQGADIIVNAARILKNHKDIRFNLLGNGPERNKVEQLLAKYQLSNCRLIDPIPYEKLPRFISANDIYLGGPFGVNIKSEMVIPNKVYEAMAMKKAVIVGESPATKELLKNEINCLFVKQGDAKHLAKAILGLKSDNLLREKIAREGYNLMIKQLTPKTITRRFINSL